MWLISITGWTLEPSSMPWAILASVRRRRRLAGGIEIGAFLDQGALIGEIHHLQLADLVGVR